MRKFSVLLFLCLLCFPVIAQDKTEPPVDPALIEHIDLLESATTAIRGLEALQDTPLNFPTREELEAYLVGALDEQFTPEGVALQMAFYVGFGFLPADYDLYGEWLALYTSQIAGFYDTETEEMNVILIGGLAPSKTLPILERITYVHEFVHALQDQHFDLDAYLADIDPNSDSDRYLGHIALVEGDATAVMTVYTQAETEANPLGTLLQLGVGALRAGNLSLPAGTPPIFETELLFPYEAGASFVQALYGNGGWDAVNQAYANPPQSTEQILHPERYLAGEMPISISLEANPPTDWAEARHGVLGELYLREWLDQGVTSALARDAADGWGGDYYQIYRDADGALAWELAIQFDSVDDQNEFANTLNSFGEARYGVATDQNGVTCWSGDGGSLCFALGDVTNRITFAPDLTDALAMMQ